MSSTANRNWPQITLDTWLLGAESCMVIGLRAARLVAGGPEACHEARLMVIEKVDSGVTLGAALIAGKLGETPADVFGSAISHYLGGVRANRRRLLHG